MVHILRNGPWDFGSHWNDGENLRTLTFQHGFQKFSPSFQWLPKSQDPFLIICTAGSKVPQEACEYYANMIFAILKTTQLTWNTILSQLLPQEARKVGRLAKAILDLSLLSPWYHCCFTFYVYHIIIFLIIWGDQLVDNVITILIPDPNISGAVKSCSESSFSSKLNHLNQNISGMVKCVQATWPQLSSPLPIASSRYL